MPVYEFPVRGDGCVEDPMAPGFIAAGSVLNSDPGAEGEAAAGEVRADSCGAAEGLVELAVCCAWCGRFQIRGRWVDPASVPDPRPTTFGMCPECFCSFSAEHFAAPSAARRRYDRCVNGLPLVDTVGRFRPTLEG